MFPFCILNFELIPPRPKIASDYPRLAEVTKKLSETEKGIQALHHEWSTAAEQVKWCSFRNLEE